MINKVKEIFQQSWQKIVFVWQHKKNIAFLLLKKFWAYIKRILIWLDQGINIIFLAGYEDESMSSRFYRWSTKKGILWKLPALFINVLFFFDFKKEGNKKILHCEKSYQNELARTGLPYTMRQQVKYSEIIKER